MNHTIRPDMSLDGAASSYSLTTLFVLVPLVTYVAWSLWDYHSASPLHKYPGPAIASKFNPLQKTKFPPDCAPSLTSILSLGWTNLWRYYHVMRGQLPVVVEEWHRRHGPLIQTGPNFLDATLPELVRAAFNTPGRGEWRKTVFYNGGGVKAGPRLLHNLFSEQDPARHAAMRRPINKYYTMTQALGMERQMDKVIEELCAVLGARFADDPDSTACDMAQWLLYYAWDVVGVVSFSADMGYLAHGGDFNGALANSARRVDWLTAMGALPLVGRFVLPIPYLELEPADNGDAAALAVRLVRERKMRAAAALEGRDGAVEEEDGVKHDLSSGEPPDFLDKFLEAQANSNGGDEDEGEGKGKVDDEMVVGWLLMNLAAGADTTTVPLRTAVYYILKDRSIWDKLRAEVDAAALLPDRPQLEDPSARVVAYRAARKLPYLDAVIQESLRLVPPVAMALERYVPPSGHLLPDGTFLPAGTVVGANPYALGRSAAAFAPDPDAFRPERWMRQDEQGETDEAFEARRAAMRAAVDLTFGGGSRYCLGKHFALVQAYKVLATLVARFDMELAEPRREWNVVLGPFTRQERIEVKLRRRG